MKKLPMITISRQYGTCGRQIAGLLAERLGLPFYDKELISLAAKGSRFEERAFEAAEEAATTALGYALGGRHSLYGMPRNDQLFMVQANVIRTVADRGPAMFVGRCADYVLDGYKETIKIFIQASPDARTRTVMAREGLSRREAEARVKRMDKARAAYYSYYTGRRWSDLESYDIVLNVSHLTPEEAAGLLDTFIRQVVEKTGAIEAETRDLRDASTS